MSRRFELLTASPRTRRRPDTTPHRRTSTTTGGGDGPPRPGTPRRPAPGYPTVEEAASAPVIGRGWFPSAVARSRPASWPRARQRSAPDCAAPRAINPPPGMWQERPRVTRLPQVIDIVTSSSSPASRRSPPATPPPSPSPPPIRTWLPHRAHPGVGDVRPGHPDRVRRRQAPCRGILACLPDSGVRTQ